MKDQPQERAKWPRLEHRGPSGAQPRTGSSGGVSPAPETAISRAGPRNKMAAPWSGISGAARSQEETLARTGSSREHQDGKQAEPLDWSIRGDAYRSPRLEHPGKKASGPGLDDPGLKKREEQKVEINN